jgi:hypothetical protein
MATPLDVLFETRTLLEAVNSDDLETQPRFIVENFWGPIKQVFTKHADWEITNSKRKLARFRGSGAQANVVKKKEKNVKTVQLPYIREKTPLSAPELFRNAGVVLGGTFQDNGAYLDRARNESLNEDLTMLRERVEEREEWLACQLLTSPGVVSYEDEEVAWTVDMQVPSELNVTLAGTDIWTDAASDMIGDLEVMNDLAAKHTGVGITDWIMGSSISPTFRNNEKLLKQLDNNNLRVGSTQVNFNDQLVATLVGGVRFWKYRRQYTDENGNTQEMWPTNVMVGLTSSFKRNSQRLFGVVEEVEETFAGELFSKSWPENDPSVRWLLVSSRPLTIVKQIGSFVKLKPLGA